MKVLLHALFLAAIAIPAYAQQLDVLIKNGRVIDGSGNPWVNADIGITGDRITFIGKADESTQAKQTIDATGLIVAPGFIDMLGQSETSLLIDNRAVSKLTQGITTEVTGEGGSIAPMNERTYAEGKDYYEFFKLNVDWQSLDEYMRRLEKQGSGVNLATFVGATQIRIAVMGAEDRAPTAEELAQMQEMVEDAMYDGALGVSTSLVYAPAFYASTEELIALAKSAAKYNGIYATHIRSESDRQMAALEEAFRIGREGGLPVQIWHLKVSGQQNWGKMPLVVKAIEDARASGLDVTADQYPYLAGATSLGATIPPKYHSGGTDAFVKTLRDPEQRAAIRRDLTSGASSDYENWWRNTGGPAGIMILSVLKDENKKFEGKNIAQVAEMTGKDPLDALMDLVADERDQVGAAYFVMSEDDLRVAMQQPWVMIDTDHGEVALDGPLSQFKAHPRGWGTFPRILGKYVREEKVLRLEDAIRKMTSLPAQRVKLNQRGLLKQDYFADVTIFNPAKVTDVATFEDPNRQSIGIEYVFVNGVLSVEKGQVTGKLGGRPLRGPGYGAAQVAPEGLAPKGKIQGAITDENGWAVSRVKVTLLDAAGKEVASVNNRRDGRFEFITDTPCQGCSLKVERMGFAPQQRAGVEYNGSNPVTFNFTLKRMPVTNKTLFR